MTVSVEDLHTDRFEFDPADHSPNPEETLHGKTFSLPMAAALAALSSDHRQLLYLAHFEELSHKELSLILGCGATTVKTRIHRAHLALKQQLSRGGLRNAVECRVGPNR